jgi:Ca2+/H+ antiporter
MNFEPYEAFSLLTTVMLLGYTISHGQATWILGLVLFGAYVVVSAGFYVHFPERLETHR